MKCAFLALAALLVAVLTLRADGVKILSVEPTSAKAGDSVSATGEGIGGTSVDALYLTNGTDDLQVQIIEQTEQLLKFKVPSGIKPGRWALMIRTKGPNPALLEQPVKLTVE